MACWLGRGDDDRVVAETRTLWRLGWCCRDVPERELVLYEDDVVGRMNASRADVVALVAAVVAGVPKKHAGDGSWTELVSCRRRSVRITQAAEHT
jgi:hypothetical protein